MPQLSDTKRGLSKEYRCRTCNLNSPSTSSCHIGIWCISHVVADGWRWHIDEVFVKIGGKTHYLWRAVNHEGEVLDAVVTKRRDKKSALKALKALTKRDGRPTAIVTDKLRSYNAAMHELRATSGIGYF